MKTTCVNYTLIAVNKLTIFGSGKRIVVLVKYQAYFYNSRIYKDIVLCV